MLADCNEREGGGCSTQWFTISTRRGKLISLTNFGEDACGQHTIGRASGVSVL